VKVLQICAAYKPAFVYGGPTMSVTMLSEQLAAAGIYTDVYTTTANGSEELPVTPGQSVNVDGVIVTYFKRITGDHTHFSPSLLKKLWKDVKGFDIIHVHTWWNTVSIFSVLIALMRNKPVVLSPRGTLSPYSFGNKNRKIKQLMHAVIGKPLLKRCHFHATSAREADAVKIVFNPLSVTVIPNFVVFPENNFVPGKQSSNVFRIAFFSRVEEKKGLDLLIGALPLLKVPYQLVIAGAGQPDYIAALKRQAQANGTEQHVRWAGFLHDEKFKFLADQDLLVLPSHDENFANVVIESLSEGTAVLVSRFVGLADYVTENQLGWTCELNPELIAEKLNLIAGAKSGLTRIREIAPAKIRQDFNKAALTRRYQTLYQNILEKD